MRILLRFKRDTDTYASSHIITLESEEKFFGFDKRDQIIDLLKNDNLNSSLMILDNDYSVLRYIRFNEFIRTDSNLTVFLYNDYVNGEDRLITVSMHNNQMDLPDAPAFLEIMTDNNNDNLCLLSRGRMAYFELTV